jgi:uncharacterized integral membrane protein
MKKENVKFILLVALALTCILMVANVERFVAFLERISSREAVASMSMYILGAMLLGMVGYIAYGIIRMIKFERKSSKFRKELKLGDAVEISSPTSYRLAGDVTVIDDEFVTVSVKVRKGTIYPQTEKKNEI